MNKIKRIFLVLVFLAFAFSAGYADNTRWKVKEKVPTFFLPKLTPALVLDGNLNEWTAAACIPVRYQSYICHRIPSHKWSGPADAGMEFYAAWNKEGLCLAAVVADDEIYNDRPTQKLWQQDGIEIFLDGRVGELFMTAPYSKGAYQLLSRPPVGDNPPLLVTRSDMGTIAGLKIAGKQTLKGYVMEMQVPWSAFPEFKPETGALFGLQFGLDDYDRRDGENEQPLMMTWRGVKGLSGKPGSFMRWVLTDRIPEGPEVSLDGIAGLDADPSLSQKNDLPLLIEVGQNLAGKAKSAEVVVRNWTGKRILISPYVPLTPLRTPWEKSRAGRTTLRFEEAPDGRYLIVAHLKDKAGKTLGVVEKPLFIVRTTIEDALARFTRADLAGLSQKKPFQAVAYLGAANTLERLKNNLEPGGDAGDFSETVLELTSRLGLLETGSLPEESAGLYDLLGLTADPESQVVVEYPKLNQAEVAFYWGAIPLVSGTVELFPTPAEALSALESEKGRFWVDPAEKTTFEWHPAVVSEEILRYQPFHLKNFSPDSQVLLVVPERKWTDAFDVKYISCVRVSSVVITDDCSPSIRKKVKDWAKETNLPLVTFEEAETQGTAFLLAGRVPELAEKFKQFSNGIFKPAKIASIKVAQNERLIRVSCPSREMAENAVRLIMAKKTVRPSDIDALRCLLIKALKPRISQKKEFFRPDQRSLFCGDLHMHSFFSDGKQSPVGTVLSTMYNYMDFAALTDHNTIEGAQLVQNLLSMYKLGYPVIVGEEITTPWAHMNAYPLTEPVSWTLSPEETVKSAHNQGAVIHWCHPGFPQSDWGASHMETGLLGTGMDAWEHIPFNYEIKKGIAGVYPAVVGTTDSHSGTFALDSERSVILSMSPSGEAVASAIKKGDVLAIIPYGERLLYGSDRLASLFLAALNDRSFFKKTKAERIKSTLKEADIAGLLRASPPK